MKSQTKIALIALTILSTSGIALHADDKPATALLKTFVDEFVEITPGEGNFPAQFDMGRRDGKPAERPQRFVRLTKPFAIAKYEVPQDLYEEVMGVNPSKWKGPRNSVEFLTWDDANTFCTKITKRLHAEHLIGADQIIRLPTEAEWEYCCRAGTTTRYSFGDQPQNEKDVSPKATILNQYAWHTGNAAGNDPPVGALKPNPWGLYDMHGYLWEFTADEWTANHNDASLSGSFKKLPIAPKTVTIRGGSWKDEYPDLTSSARRPISRTEKDDAVGFRCVRSRPGE